MADRLYDTPLWADARARALARDGHRCTVARLLGGECSDRLDVHHLVPVREGGDPFDVDNLLSCCSSHHGRLEALRRHVLRERERDVKRCRHYHPYKSGREACERRLAMG
jgi:hypothetical protein